EIEALVAGIGQRKLSVLTGPGFPAGSELEAMGVARISFGPWTQRLALAGLGATGRLTASRGGHPRATRGTTVPGTPVPPAGRAPVTARSRHRHGCYDGARHLSITPAAQSCV